MVLEGKTLISRFQQTKRSLVISKYILSTEWTVSLNNNFKFGFLKENFPQIIQDFYTGRFYVKFSREKLVSRMEKWEWKVFRVKECVLQKLRFISWTVALIWSIAAKYSVYFQDILPCFNFTGDTCSHTQFRCGTGTCIFLRFRCDRIVDCPDSSDEVGCGTCSEWKSFGQKHKATNHIFATRFPLCCSSNCRCKLWWRIQMWQWPVYPKRTIVWSGQELPRWFRWNVLSPQHVHPSPW